MSHTQLVVSALENGTVLDHIPAENVYKALDILNLKGIESQITIRFATLANAVAKNDADTVTAAAEEVLLLINDRNNKCRLLK